MNTLLFSDPHISDHEDFSYTLENGFNSRLWDCLNVIKSVMKYRDKYNCDVVVCAGDVFHTPMGVETFAFQETYKVFEKLAESTKHLIIMAGNHDMASVNKPVSTIYALGRLPNTTLVVDGYKWIKIKDLVIHCIPYIKNKDKLTKHIEWCKSIVSSFKKRRNILVTHFGIDEAVNGPNEILLKNMYRASSLMNTGVDHVFCGHHHTAQKINSKMDVIGSPLQLNMLDRGDPRGILIYDDKEDKTIRIWLKNGKFFLYSIESKKDFAKMLEDKEKFSDNYVRVLLTIGTVSESKVKEALSAARMHQIIPTKNRKTAIRNAAVTKKAVSNIGNLEASVEDYVKHVRPSGLSRDKLISVGKRLLERNRVEG